MFVLTRIPTESNPSVDSTTMPQAEQQENAPELIDDQIIETVPIPEEGENCKTENTTTEIVSQGSQNIESNLEQHFENPETYV